MTRTLAALVALWMIAPHGVAAAQPDATSEEAAHGPSQAGADAAATERARAHFRLGVDFYRERNFRAALIEFERAYAEAPHYKLLYNLGQASLELQEYAGAIDYLTAYLEQGGEEISEERRKEVLDTLRYLESRIAHVTISSNREGAEIYVNDTLVGRVPLAAPVRVGAGRHKFTALVAGAPAIERIVDIAAQERREIRLDFAERRELPAAAPPVEGVLDEPLIDEEPGDGSGAIWAGVTTAVLGAGAITMTVLTALAQKDYQDELDTVTTKAELDELRDDAETKALITDIAWGATLVSGIVTAVLILSNDGPADTASRRGDRTAAGVAVGVGAGGVTVEGRF